MIAHLVHNNVLRHSLLFFAFFCAFASHLAADGEYDEYMDEDDNQENDDCTCYWPEYDQDVVNINNGVYSLLKDFAERGLITPEFSSYW